MVRALGIGGRGIRGIDMRRYTLDEPTSLADADLVSAVEGKIRRATACARAMCQLAAEGFQPDLIVAHPGWGESMFCKDVWPDSKLVAYGEFYYLPHGADYAFDPEFSHDSLERRMRLRLRNTALLHAYSGADGILCPTPWQRSCLPAELQAKSTTIFDGIDTGIVRPDEHATIRLGRSGVTLSRNDSVLTFVNRNLEPYRGFHVFMRALPEILARNPQTRCVIVGEDSVSYGSPPENFNTWREALLHEVGARLPMDRMHFVGRVGYTDYLRLLQVSTCHVYLTYPFVLGWSCIEALAAGCRVVASDTPPVRDAIDDGVNGRLFGFFDHEQLAQEASAVLQDPSHFDTWRERAVLRAQSEYDLEHVCKPQQIAWLGGLLGVPQATGTFD